MYSEHEQAKAEFDRLRTKMKLGRRLFLMEKAEAERMAPSWFQNRNIDRDEFMAMIAAREKMIPGSARELPGAASPAKKSTLDNAWAVANAKLIAQREGCHGNL